MVLIWYDNPSFATKRVEDGVVGFFAKELLKGTDGAAAKEEKTIGCGTGSLNGFTPPFFGKIGLHHHAARHLDNGFIGALSNAVVLRGLGGGTHWVGLWTA